jgi:hypothetical protein
MALMEMLVSMAVGAVIFGTAVAAVVTLLNLHIDVRERHIFTVTRARLAAQFREDARQSIKWTGRNDGTNGWLFQLADSMEMHYQVRGSALIWTRSKDGVLEARQRFVQPPGAQFSVSLVDSEMGKPRLIKLDIEYPAGRLPSATQRHQIVGRLSNALQFAVPNSLDQLED